MAINVLILGGGGREHALAWAVSRSPLAGTIYATPGSDGMAALAQSVPIPPTQPKELADWAVKNHIGLTIVGPEVYLEQGIVDVFQERGLLIFGPSRQAARLEWSKVAAKEFMAEHNIPTAAFKVFDEAETAIQYIHSTKGPWVIKADGLAAGKGVTVTSDMTEALGTVESMMINGKFGSSGHRIVIEDMLYGEELSLLAITDGKSYRLLVPAQDHKRVGAGDTGPNTGGMGAYAPTTLMNPDLRRRIEETIVKPSIDGMSKEGTPFVGVLYVGLMLTPEGPKVVEYNVRFGDPETQAILPLLTSDLLALFLSASQGTLENHPVLEWRSGHAACVVMASGGYPGDYDKGVPIHGLELPQDNDLIVFHAGTRCAQGTWQTDGGRVLNVVGLGSTLQEALDKAYAAISKIMFNGAHYRHDIGWREIARSEKSQG